MTESSVLAQIPTSFYIVAGSLILANLGTVVTVLYGVGKIIWWMAKLESRVEHIEVVHSKDINNAHTILKELKKELETTN